MLMPCKTWDLLHKVEGWRHKGLEEGVPPPKRLVLMLIPILKLLRTLSLRYYNWLETAALERDHHHHHHIKQLGLLQLLKE